MQNEWMNQFLHAPYGGMGLNAYNRMRGAGYSNQQIVAGIRSRGLKVGELARPHVTGGAQPNWMNQFTGTMGNIGLSTYNRMKDAGYSVHDIRRDQPASGMIFGVKAQAQMNKDLVQAAEDEKARVLQEQQLQQQQAPPQMTTAGAGDIGAGATAQGVKTDISATDNLATGSTSDAFKVNRNLKIDPNTGLPIAQMSK